MTIFAIGYPSHGAPDDRGAWQHARVPPVEQPLDRRTLRALMGTAAYYARRVARTMVLSEVDREDVEQDILLALIERRRFFDPARGVWSSFADLVARQAAQAIADRIGHERRLRGDAFDAADRNRDPVVRTQTAKSRPTRSSGRGLRRLWSDFAPCCQTSW